MAIRPATQDDHEAIWDILKPIFREGETYPIDPNVSQDDALAYWFASHKQVYVYEDEMGIIGTYYLCPNSTGPADHVANCGYATHPKARGKGVASQMCLHSFEAAKLAGFRGMQFNLVVATNTIAFGLWQKLGMELVGTLKGAFAHPTLGDVDAHVMFKRLD
ncbi:N-acetyltransferase family protein [Litorimonas sp. RW-G-Af-16]|uniref:GNAT family N-acetyltransferase n=1 Tax=Litorimonas sp. RW-G-Af-16 TaxID=3241168 RepID=UPI00390C42EE